MQLEVRSSRRIYDANAVLKLFFLANSGKKREENWPPPCDDQGRKGNDQGKRVGLFLGYCDQMDLLRTTQS